MSTPEDSESVAETVAPSAPGRGGPLWPLLAVVVLVPSLCYAVMDFLVVPKLKASMGVLLEAGQRDAATEASGAADAGGETGGPGEHVVEFGPTIVNLAGSASSRYLRANFSVASADPNIAEIVKEHQSALKDAAISVLSAQTLDGLDAEASRNTTRNQLIDQFNRTLGSQVVGQIYFSEFVVQ